MIWEVCMITDFSNYADSGILYGGHAGDKDGVIYNNENWILKYPKSTFDLKGNVEIPYTTTPLSEFIGSHIYKLIGIEVQDTELGIINNKIVVACKDFRKDGEDLIDYNHIKNKHSEEIEKQLQKMTISTPSSTTSNIDELQIIMKNNPYFIQFPDLIDRFWDMFVVDSLIGNNDRNEGNWGLLINRNTKEIRIAPVYDNGAAFNTKSSDLQLLKIINDERLLKDSIYNNSICAFDKEGKKINPLKFIEKLENSDLNAAVLRIVPQIDINKIYELIDSIPTEYKGIKVMSNIQKDFYKKTIEYRLNNVLIPTYNKLLQ